jgi:hypothetical protein
LVIDAYIFGIFTFGIMEMLAKKSSKNQITLPKAIVAGFEDVDYFDVSTQNGRIILEPVRTRSGDEVRSRLETLGIRETDIDAAIEYARS